MRRVLRHVVMFQFKAGTEIRTIREIESAFAALPSKIEAIRDCSSLRSDLMSKNRWCWTIGRSSRPAAPRYFTVMATAPVQSGDGGLAMLALQRSMNFELGRSAGSISRTFWNKRRASSNFRSK